MKSKTSVDKKSSAKKATENSFPVVAIGASAGGLEAMMELLTYLPPDTGMAFIYVQHLSPDHKSLLTEILSKKTKMKVQEIDDMDHIEPNNLFVIPYNKGIEVTDGHIKLIPRSDSSAAISIDILFSSLAIAQKGRVIGIILSGSAGDGTAGMKTIKEEGGLTFAQDDTAKFTSMPHSAISAGAVDFTLSPKEIAHELGRLSKHPLLKTFGLKNGEETIIENDNPELINILHELHTSTGVDFSAYKLNTIKRRIIRRMLLYKIKNLKDYGKLLSQKKEEIDILYQDLLIHVTSFFRDNETHKYLKENLFPKLLKRIKSGESLRIWVPACATGEEAYSMAMMLQEIQEAQMTNILVQIFATDISEQAIRKAREGIYTKEDLQAVSPRRIQRFFSAVDGNLRVNKTLRSMCVFAPHNILQDPPFSRLDFISCCNLFIYLDNPAQNKALTTFHYSLNDNGFLMLGKSENITQSSNLFTGFNKKYKIFSRKLNSGARKLPQLLPRSTNHLPAERNNSTLRKAPMPVSLYSGTRDLDREIDAYLVAECMPASVVINHQLEILQFRGNTDLFLTHPKGKATFHILKMIRPEIAFDLRTGLMKVFKSNTKVRCSGIELKLNSQTKIISIDIVPLHLESNEPLVLVLFTEHEQSDTMHSGTGNGKSPSLAKDRRIKKLELELAAAQSDALAFAQEQEVFTEELQSANEEVVSSNEELQTLNEELETSKEEIESANEELITTNQELQTRNDLLNESYDYSEAVIATMHNPMVVLDKHFRVKSANATFYEDFHVEEKETEGVLLYDLGNRQWNIPKLRELLEDILPEKSLFHNFEITHTFPVIGERIMLLNASRIIQKTNQDELILLVFSDVTDVRNKANELQRKEKELLMMQINAEINLRKTIEDSEKRYNMMLLESPFAFAVVKGKDMIIASANDSAKKMWGKGNSIEGKPMFNVLPELRKQAIPELLQQVYTTGIPYIANEFYAQVKRKGKLEDAYFNFVYQPYRETDDTISGVTIIAIEVTPQAEFNLKMQESEENFRLLTDLLPQKISEADAKGNVFFFNQNWLLYSGLTADKLTNNGWMNITHPDERDEIKKRWQKSIKTGEAFEMEVRIRNAEGQYKWHLSRATGIKDSRGRTIKWLGAATEIQKQVEQRTELEMAVERRTDELSSANEDLLKMNRELEAFTYVSSHDLQEPLRKIQTFAGRILEKENQNLSEKGKEYFHLMQNAAERMQTLIQDLLAFSHLNTSDRKFETTDLGSLIEEVLLEFSEEISGKNARIEIVESCSAKIIPFQFRQLLQNLLGNALKFSNPEVRPHVSIRCNIVKIENTMIPQLSIDETYCHISISDNGIGFEEEYAEKIFDVFQKLHNKDEYPGTGIGLAIVKKIVENHNGLIRAHSQLGIGTTFDIYIPD